MGTLDNGLKREWRRLTAENAEQAAEIERLRAAIQYVLEDEGFLPRATSQCRTYLRRILNEQTEQPPAAVSPEQYDIHACEKCGRPVLPRGPRVCSTCEQSTRETKS